MKAINLFVLNILFICLFVSCKPQDQQQHDLDPSSKAYFEIKNNSKFIFTEISDTNISIEYNSGNFNNNRANPDIENSEIMFYELTSPGQPKFTVRCQSGGTQFKDQIALVTNFNDSTVIGPVFFNLGGSFGPGQNSGDSVFQYANYTIGSAVYTDVIRIKLLNNIRYHEVFFAKTIGLIARKEKSGKFYYVKRYRLS